MRRKIRSRSRRRRRRGRREQNYYYYYHHHRYCCCCCGGGGVGDADDKRMAKILPFGLCYGTDVPLPCYLLHM